MLWFYIALLAPGLWAASGFVDKYLINRYTKDGGIGALLIFSSLIGIPFIVGIPLFKPEVFTVDSKSAVVMILAGFIYLFGFLPYLHALEKDDTSLVVSLYQAVPVFTFVLAYFLLGETLTQAQLIGSCIIIIGAIGISLDITTAKRKFKKSVFWLMMLAALAIAVNAILFKFVAVDTDFWTASFWEYIGLVLTLVPLFLVASYRKQFAKVISHNAVAVWSLNGLNEIINIAGKMLMAFATLLVPLTLARVVNGFQPLFLLLFGLILSQFFPKIIKESIEKKVIIQKILFSLVMLLGTYLISM